MPQVFDNPGRFLLQFNQYAMVGIKTTSISLSVLLLVVKAMLNILIKKKAPLIKEVKRIQKQVTEEHTPSVLKRLPEGILENIP